MQSAAIDALLALQLSMSCHLTLYDLVPLGEFNDLKTVQAVKSRQKLFAETIVSALPYAFGLVASLLHLGQSYPRWLLGRVNRFCFSESCVLVACVSPRTRRSVSGNVRARACLPAEAQWYQAEFAACEPT